MNMNIEREQLLQRMKYLEQRIQTHTDILKTILEDKGPKIPMNLEPVRNIIAQAEAELDQVNRKLEDLS